MSCQGETELKKWEWEGGRSRTFGISDTKERGFFKEEKLVKVRMLFRDIVRFSPRGNILESLYPLHFHFFSGCTGFHSWSQGTVTKITMNFLITKLKGLFLSLLDWLDTWNLLKLSLFFFPFTTFDVPVCPLHGSFFLGILKMLVSWGFSPLTFNPCLRTPYLITLNLQSPTGKLYLVLP